MTTWEVSGGDPVLPGIFARLDDDAERCGPTDPGLFELVPRRFLVAFRETPDGDAPAQLATCGTVRWMYRQLGLAEVDAAEPSALQALPFVDGVVPAWNTLGATRSLVVGLNALCAFAANQASNPASFYRHPPEIGYPILTAADTDTGTGTGAGARKQVDLDPSLRLETPPALVPVINMSLGTVTVDYPTALNDVVNLATAAASSEVLVVVAAGNCGRRPGDSMSAWARPDWVLSVGATSDAAGTQIAAYSSRGEPGPDLVALGHSDLDPRKKGTSFAAPRVTGYARLVVAAFCELGRAMSLARGETPVGVPAVGYGIIDDFGDEIWWEPPNATAIQALPFVGVDTDVASELATATPVTIATTPAIVRDVLISAARPVDGAPPSEAGAGFVDQELVIARLASITGADLWSYFAGGDDAEPDGDGRWLALRPFDEAGLHDLASVVSCTGPTIRFDYRTGRWLALAQPDERIREQSPRGWPIDLTDIRRHGQPPAAADT